jgi:hypothetical protein
MRGEGTTADVRRSIAAFRESRSCTSLFHHGDVEVGEKQTRGRLRKRSSVDCGFRVVLGAGSCGAALGGYGAEPRHHTNTTLDHACRLLLHLLCLIVRDERVDNRLQLSVHHLF